MSASAEQWKPVPGTTRYEASDQGRVRSVDGMNTVGALCRGQLLRSAADKDGYRRVSLHGRTMQVHRVVLKAFIGESPPLIVGGSLFNG